jgi:Glycosyl hydrolase family 3 N terminal domain
MCTWFKCSVCDGSYNAVNGVPSCADNYLLQTILREYWGWTAEDQWVTSDCDAVQNIYSPHNYTDTPEQAVADALNAGKSLVLVLEHVSWRIWDVIASTFHGFKPSWIVHTWWETPADFRRHGSWLRNLLPTEPRSSLQPKPLQHLHSRQIFDPALRLTRQTRLLWSTRITATISPNNIRRGLNTFLTRTRPSSPRRRTNPLENRWGLSTFFQYQDSCPH